MMSVSTRCAITVSLKGQLVLRSRKGSNLATMLRVQAVAEPKQASTSLIIEGWVMN